METSRSNRHNQIAAIVLAGCTLIFPLALLALNQTTNLETASSFCPSKRLFGISCLGCGMSKSLVFLFEGNIGKSLMFHGLGIAVALYALAILIFVSAGIKTRNPASELLLNPKFPGVLFLLMVIYHLLRVSGIVPSENF